MSADKTPPTGEEMAVDLLAKLWGFASNDFKAGFGSRPDEYSSVFWLAETVLKEYGYDTTALRKKYSHKGSNQ